MVKYKYNVGDKLGPWNILFLERLDEVVDSRGRKPYGMFECPGCKKSIKTRIKNVVNGSFHWCPECRSKVRSERWLNNNLGGKNSKDLVGQQFGSWTVLTKLDERQNGHVLWLCECKCGTQQKISTCNLTQNVSTQCVSCSLKSNQSKGIKAIIKVLEENNINYKTEYTFEDCKYKKKLRFDFYLPDYNCCIEYDGEQHFKEKTCWKDNLEKIQLRDSIKNQYCKEHNIKLIRIPYWNLKEISLEYLFSLIQGGDIGDVSI